MMDDLVPRKIARYGFKPALRQFEPTANVFGIKIKPEVDPRDVLAGILNNQWACGSCTSNTVEEAVRYDAILDGHDPGQLSRWWIYYGERKLEGVLGQGDTGAFGHDGFMVARRGIPPESAWPYAWSGMEQDQAPDPLVFDPPSPPSEALSEAHYFTLTKPVVSVPQNQHSVMAVLSNRQTVAIGFTVYPSFESQQTAQTGIVVMPQQGEQPIGGHEVLIVGYLKSEPHYALVMNSWGRWGLNQSGFFLMPWAMIVDPSITSDLRTIARPIAR